MQRRPESESALGLGGNLSRPMSPRPPYALQHYFTWTGDSSMTDAAFGFVAPVPQGLPWDQLLPPIRANDLLSSSALRRSPASYTALLMAGIGLASVPVARLQALPMGPTVVQGAATVTTTSPTSVQVAQQTERVVINWSSFNVGIGELVQFLQGGQHWQALNRDLSGAISQVAGRISGNGQFFLSNAAAGLNRNLHTLRDLRNKTKIFHGA